MADYIDLINEWKTTLPQPDFGIMNIRQKRKLSTEFVTDLSDDRCDALMQTPFTYQKAVHFYSKGVIKMTQKDGRRLQGHRIINIHDDLTGQQYRLLNQKLHK